MRNKRKTSRAFRNARLNGMIDELNNLDSRVSKYLKLNQAAKMVLDSFTSVKSRYTRRRSICFKNTNISFDSRTVFTDTYSISDRTFYRIKALIKENYDDVIVSRTNYGNIILYKRAGF